MWYINEHSSKENFLRLINFTLANKLIKGLDGKYYRAIEEASKKYNIQLCGKHIINIEYSKLNDEVIFIFETTYSPLSAFREDELLNLFNNLLLGLMKKDISYGLYFSFEEKCNEEYIITYSCYNKVTEELHSSFIGRYHTKEEAKTALSLFSIYKCLDDENQYVLDNLYSKSCFTIQKVDNVLK